MAMESKVKGLANFIKARMAAKGVKYVVWLGAGASYASGIMPTPRMKAEIVKQYDGEGSTIDKKFDNLWDTSGKDQRYDMLAPLLRDKIPSSGYHKLAELIKAGYFDIIIAFNFDDLLEKALDKAGFHDFRVIINELVKEDEILGLLESPEPRVKLLKLHGDWKSKKFAFSAQEILEYHRKVGKVVAKYSQGDVIICGYAFKDVNVIRAFSSEGGAIYYVNPSGAEGPVVGFMEKRKSYPGKALDGKDGEFDNFFTLLHDELKREPKAPLEEEPGEPEPRDWRSTVGFTDNPFRELDASQEDQEELNKYFVLPPCFDDVLGQASKPRTVFLTAPRGGGKSAACKMIQFQCEKGTARGTILAVPYTYDEFDDILAKSKKPGAITLNIHKERMLRCCLRTFLDWLKQRSNRIKDLSSAGMDELGRFVANYYPDFLVLFRIDSVLKSVGAPMDAIELRRAILNENLDTLLEKVEPLAVPIVRLMAGLMKIGMQSQAYHDAPLYKLLEDFFALVSMVGIEAVYILVDGVDASPEAADNLTIGGNFLEPLLSDVHLMRLPKVAFKFFIPSEMESLIKAKSSIRSELFRFIPIYWTKELLLEVLKQRLLVYSDLKISSLDERSETTGIDEELVKAAEGSPRNLLGLGDSLLGVMEQLWRSSKGRR